jgi:hypothetical protein
LLSPCGSDRLAVPVVIVQRFSKTVYPSDTQTSFLGPYPKQAKLLLGQVVRHCPLKRSVPCTS